MNTNIIPTKLHGYIDYLTAGSLLVLPLLFSKRKTKAETIVPIAMGAFVLVQSLFTRYELGAKKKLDMKKHLRMDYANGTLMAASPFLLGFRKRSWVPHVAVGLSELIIAGLSKKDPDRINDNSPA
jgi:hypothetical protein